MKILTQFLKFSNLMLFCGMLLLACNPAEPEPEPKILSGVLTVEEIDALSDHMRFVGSTVKEGNMPAAPSGSSLKISIQDTLYLPSGIPIAVKFLHDELTNVAGAYIQVHSWNASTNAVVNGTYHFDVPELNETAESDTVSVIMVGFDPDSLTGVPPAGAPPFDITITPYDESGQPIDNTEVPVVVDAPTGSDVCGLVMPGTRWEWENSCILNLEYIHTWINFYPAPDPNDSTSVYSYFYAPEILYGGDQLIKGCCGNDGISYYTASCLGDTLTERYLLFPTYYQQVYESIEFNSDGTFHRITRDVNATPAPIESDFCYDIVGIVYSKKNKVDYVGNWTITPGVAITIEHIYEQEDRVVDYLRLQTTSSTDFGWGNPGGAVIRLSCNQLMLLQPAGEGVAGDLWKVYKRVGEDGATWWNLHHL